MKKVLCLGFMVVFVMACGNAEKALFSKAKRLSDQGEYKKAINVYSVIIRKNPANVAAYASRGLLYEQLKAKMPRNYPNTANSRSGIMKKQFL